MFQIEWMSDMYYLWWKLNKLNMFRLVYDI